MKMVKNIKIGLGFVDVLEVVIDLIYFYINLKNLKIVVF